MFELDFHLTCRCGRHRVILAHDVPEAWQKGCYAIRQEVWPRMYCLGCGRRGRPDIVIVSPMENRLLGQYLVDQQKLLLANEREPEP